MKLSKNQITKYSILLLILVGMILFLVRPYLKEIKKIYINLSKEAIALEEKYQSGEDINKSTNDFTTYKDRVPEYSELFTQEGDELTLVTALEKIASKYNLNQELSLSLDKTQISEEVKRIPFNFVVKGSFNSILNYLVEVSEMKNSLSIQNLNINQNDDNELEAHFLGYTYWQSL